MFFIEQLKEFCARPFVRSDTPIVVQLPDGTERQVEAIEEHWEEVHGGGHMDPYIAIKCGSVSWPVGSNKIYDIRHDCSRCNELEEECEGYLDLMLLHQAERDEMWDVLTKFAQEWCRRWNRGLPVELIAAEVCSFVEERAAKIAAEEKALMEGRE